ELNGGGFERCGTNFHGPGLAAVATISRRERLTTPNCRVRRQFRVLSSAGCLRAARVLESHFVRASRAGVSRRSATSAKRIAPAPSVPRTASGGKEENALTARPAAIAREV